MHYRVTGKASPSKNTPGLHSQLWALKVQSLKWDCHPIKYCVTIWLSLKIFVWLYSFQIPCCRSWSEKKWPHLILNLSLGVFSFDQCQETKASHIWNAPLIKTPLQRSTYYSSEPNAWDSNNSKRSIWFSFWWFFKELKPLSSETIPNRCPQLNLFCSAALFVEIIVICWQYMK